MKRNKSLILLFGIALILLSSFKGKKCQKADLAISEIQQPEYDSEIRGTHIFVEIKNKGKKESPPCSIKIFDLDISAQEAVDRGLDSLVVQLIQENNGRAQWYAEQENQERYEIDKNHYDYDFYFERTENIPALKPGQKHTVTFNISDYWIYDSNCEFRVIIDESNEMEDCDRTNNTQDFFGWG